MAQRPIKRLKTECSPGGSTEMFDGIRAFFVENGLGKTRLSILTEKLTKGGGKCHKTLQDSTTHLFVSQNVTLERLPRLLGQAVTDKVKVVRADWISKCLAEGRVVDLGPYTIRHEICNLSNQIMGSEKPGPSSELNQSNQSIESGKPGPPSELNQFKLTKSLDVGLSTSPTPYKVNKGNDSDSSYSDSGDERSPPKVATRILDLSRSPKKVKEKWICTKASTSEEKNHNEHITDQLQILATSYANTKDQWRALGYKKAISSIKSYHKKIETEEECHRLPFVGERLAKKIWEIVQTGHLRRLDFIDPKTEAINLFSGVWGAGPKAAELWVSKGLRTLEDLKRHGGLNKQQEIGLRYYDEFNERMPREEAGKIGEVVKAATEIIDPSLLCITCGSYRRGKSTCGDVDVLVSHPDGKSHHGVMGPLLCELKSSGFLTDDLVSADIEDQKKYMGVCKLPGEDTKHRRLDIIVVPYNEWACAIVYFTGSDHFNRSIRLLAKKNGMSLSNHALKTGVVRKDGAKIYDGSTVTVNSERELFDLLGLEYREPQERDW